MQSKLPLEAFPIFQSYKNILYLRIYDNVKFLLQKSHIKCHNS
jgi:hypothetical protein